MRKSIVAAVALSTVFLVACAPAEEPSGEGGTDGVYEYVEVNTGGGKVVGCVIWDGFRAGGIDCNWSE